MKIHTDILSYEAIRSATVTAGAVYTVNLERVGSKSRDHAFKLALTGTSGRPANFREHEAATWDEWGMVLAYLYSIDPAMHCGKHSYQSAAHFHWVTGDRFKTLTPPLQHKLHRWEPRELSEPGFVARHGYSEGECKCGSVQRWVIGQSFWDTDLDKLVAVSKWAEAV